MERILKRTLPGGVFKNVSPSRSKTMTAIRSTGNHTTERRLRLALVRSGLRGWTMHPKEVPGHPDFYFTHARLSIFVDGCFWHGCPKCGHIPSTRSAYWSTKISQNRASDGRTTARLRSQGFRVVRVWEHQLRHPEKLHNMVSNRLSRFVPTKHRDSR